MEGCSHEEKVLLQDVLHPSPASTSYSTHGFRKHYRHLQSCSTSSSSASQHSEPRTRTPSLPLSCAGRLTLAAKDLVKNMLNINPKERLMAFQVLNLPYKKTD
ncbi:hypothetical protein ZWY2020_035358 [Hordeum vulgare]|nr:hypothetical protein ZWY2020_035358 [Hordeum vulgare]